MGQRVTSLLRMRPPVVGPVHAFTLIELLVVIGVIALLMGIALPAFSQVRRSGDQTRETSALRQVGIGYTVYAHDNRGAILPGFLPLEWVTPGMDTRQFRVFSSEAGGPAPVYGSTARRYPWRLAPYVGYSRETMVANKQLRAEYNDLPDRPDTRDGFQWAIAQSPGFGLNSTYVGGDVRRGGFHQPSIARWGKYYVTAIDEPRFPDTLMIFATSRGYHPVSGGRVVPGRHRIEGPWMATSVIGQVPTFSPWAAPLGAFDPSREPSTYGHLDYRHFKRAIITMFDGHVAPFGTDDMRDMRRWSNQALSATWRPQ